MSPAMQALRDQIARVIEEQIKPLINGDYHDLIRTTVLIRFTDNPRADILVTSDDDAGIRAIVERNTSGQKGEPT